MRRHPHATLAVLAVITLTLVVLRIWFVGGRASPDSDVLLWRATRCASAAAVGACLSLAGVFLQCLLRNRLASPDLLGLASGSAFSILLGIHLGLLPASMSNGYTLLAALIGAATSLTATFLLSRRGRVLDPVLLILTGVAIGVICSAGTMLVRHLMPLQQTALADRMLMGSLREDVTFAQLALAAAAALSSILAIIVLGPKLDIASFSEDEARSLGAPLPMLRVVMFVGAGLLTAAAVMLAGPIGFVGLICPHIARAVCGPKHRTLALPAALMGAALMIAADITTRLVDLPSGRMPISIVTALVGGVSFVWVVRGQRGMVKE